jgi:hypothetical protein
MENFAKYAVDRGAVIKPLLIPGKHTGGTGLMNPSIYNRNGKILINIRQVNYTFYHSEKKLFQHPFGPLTYLHPENDMHLRTWNWYGELDDDLNITKLHKIDTTNFPEQEKWDFVGLEDARLIDWGDGKLYTTGVRRDLKPNGEGRMELCEIVEDGAVIKEVSRFRIPPPNDPDSFCEKNWMPIDDMPYCFVKWCNPVEIVKVDPVEKTSETVFLGKPIYLPNDQRGGSQVIRLDENHRITMTHEVALFHSEVGRKDAIYRHRFLIWDNDWNLVKYTPDFSILDGDVEFSVGMCMQGDDVLLTFGFQDNAAFVMRVAQNTLMDYIDESIS